MREIFLLKLEEDSMMFRYGARHSEPESQKSNDHIGKALKMMQNTSDKSLKKKFTVKVNLKLANLPKVNDCIDPKVLLGNPLLREYGQLVNLKLARVVSVFQPASFMSKRYKRKQCACVNSPLFVEDKNDNILKIFKNQVTYSTKMGKSLYYSVNDD